MSQAIYDINTPVGQVRFHAADTNTPNATFEDEEILYCLNDVGQGDPVMAASFLLEALAADFARIAQEIRRGRFMKDQRQVSKELAQRAATLRDLSNVTAPIQTPDQVFSTDNSSMSLRGSMDGW